MFQEDKDTRLKKAITERQVFSYPYWRGFFMRNFGHKWCLCCKKRPKRDDWLQEDAKAKLNREIDILEIVKKLRVSYFASEIALKPRQRHLVGFFDDYKLKTPDEKLEEMLKTENDPMKEKRLSMKGTKGEEYGHMDDLIDRDEKEAARVLQAVNRACTDKDPIDAIIADRITNLDVTDGFTRRARRD